MPRMKDAAGLALSGTNAESLGAFEQACHQLRCLIADPVASCERAIEAAPTMPMAQVLKAYLYLGGTEPAGLQVARQACERAAELGGDERERTHAAAAALLATGRWREAGRALEDIAARHPRDALALQIGHQIDFFTGDSRMLRDRMARALPAWQRGMPGYHAVLGMHAFGLEETGDYEAAEAQGRLAVELEPRDGWAWHAVAHTLEMRQRQRDGIAWLKPNAALWSEGSFLAVHNWWHVALFHLELDEIDEVLRLYDACIAGSSVVLELIDQSALLWRLHLRGVALGGRWAALAERWAPLAAAGNYGFNDFHAMMAFVGAGRTHEQEQVLQTQREVMRRDDGDDNAGFTREVAHPASQALHAFGAGDHARAVRLLRPIRSHAHRFGGSHAQRDLLDLTLIEAALRCGDRDLAAALAAERLALRPRSPQARDFVARAAAASRGAAIAA